MFTSKTQSAISLAVIISLVASYFSLFINQALAAPLANVSNTLSSQTASAPANHTVVFRTPTGAADTTDTITLTIPTGFTTNTFDFADIDLAFSAGAQSNCTAPTYSNEATIAAAAAAGTWGATLSGQVLTIAAPASAFATPIAANACVQIQIGTHATAGATGNTQITNHATPGSYEFAIAGTFGDTGSTTVNILTDSEVDIAANVAQSITFSISDTSIGFGTLNSAAARYATGDTLGNAAETEAHTLIVGTNAANGYTMTASGTTLTNAGAGGATVTAIGASNTASSAGIEQFGIRMNATGGTGAVAAPYAAAGFAFDSAAFPDQVASAAGATSNTTYSVRYLANIAANTEAGAYTASVTYVATANF